MRPVRGHDQGPACPSLGKRCCELGCPPGLLHFLPLQSEASAVHLYFLPLCHQPHQPPCFPPPFRSPQHFGGVQRRQVTYRRHKVASERPPPALSFPILLSAAPQTMHWTPFSGVTGPLPRPCLVSTSWGAQSSFTSPGRE